MLPISVCIIAKNEEAHINTCLQRLADCFQEIIVVDTGSTDRTVEIAGNYTANIYPFTWINDFSAARNYAVSKASCDWILTVDCDEYLTTAPEEIKLLRPLLSSPRTIGRVAIKSYSQASDDLTTTCEYVGRLYSRHYYQYKDCVHEQLASTDGSPPSYVQTVLCFDHEGYRGEELLRLKTQRNLALLMNEYHKKPDDPYILFQIGQCYYSTGRHQEALTYFDQVLSLDVNPSWEYIQTTVENYGYCLLHTKQLQAALSLEGIYQDFSGRADFVFLMGLIYMQNGMLEQAITEFTQAMSMTEYAVEGTNSYRAAYNLGVIYECSGRLPLARAYYQQCGDFPPALARLKNIPEDES